MNQGVWERNLENLRYFPLRNRLRLCIYSLRLMCSPLVISMCRSLSMLDF
jgi:hypothetical protein